MMRIQSFLQRLVVLVVALLVLLRWEETNALSLSSSKQRRTSASVSPLFVLRRPTTPPPPTTTRPSFYETLAASSSSKDHVTIAQQLNVKPGMMDFSPRFWKFAWRSHGWLLPMLHFWDQARTSDLDNSLKVLWCKALVGLDRTSPAYDDSLAYDMLPSITRRLVKLPEWFFPRLVHFIIELRTVFLDRALREEIQYAKKDVCSTQQSTTKENQPSSCRIRLVTLGAGYDTRSVKFLNDDKGWRIDEAWELDMPQVVSSKSIMLERLQARRPNAKIPQTIGQDLTDFERLRQQLSTILDRSDKYEWYTIFVVEGVLIYLKEQDRSRVLSLCSEMLKSRKQHGSFLFADRIRKIRDPTASQVKSWLQSDGWELVDGSFCVHPGKARHMGAARVVSVVDQPPSAVETTAIPRKERTGSRRTTSLSVSSSARTSNNQRRRYRPLYSSINNQNNPSESNLPHHMNTTTSFVSRNLIKILTGKTYDKNKRDDASPSSEGTSERQWLSRTLWVLTHLRPAMQLAMALLLYLFHTLVLSQHSITFPFQLIPDNRGYFTGVGWDSVAGMATLMAYQRYIWKCHHQQQQRSTSRLRENQSETQTGNHPNAATIPSLLTVPSQFEVPWRGVWQSYYARITSLITFVLLILAHRKAGIVSLWWEDRLYGWARFFPITTAMHRSLTVLTAHVSWMAMGAFILRWVPRPQPFFPEQSKASKWFQSSFDTQWLWWVTGGYFVSAWLVNIADMINSYVLPLSLLEAVDNPSIVSKLVNPEGQDWLASIVGYVAPCLTAPWWEEILYRSFLLPTLVLQLGGYKRSVFVSGILFSLHHASEAAFLPLCILGWVWAIVYAKSGNLWTTIVIHSMWNSRIFLGSWLGV